MNNERDFKNKPYRTLLAGRGLFTEYFKERDCDTWAKGRGGLEKGRHGEKFCLTREYHWAIFLGMVFGLFCFGLRKACSKDPIGSTSK
ncbi:MAG TPA: hypothetical protein VLK23_14010 [Thermodesulfobacteriota bacterium]|nr:hypothetical protein [Thermodesulfobacteriota bacterium]